MRARTAHLDGLSDHVSLDGKTLRRSHDRTAGKAALQLVSAWASANRLVLGQVAVADESNEITALPVLIRLLDRRGCPITIDAIGSQTAIAILRHLALNLPRQDTTTQVGLKDKRFKAGCRLDYLEQIIRQVSQ